MIFNGDGRISGTYDVKLSTVAASAFAYLADGKNGMKVVQIFAPGSQPNYEVFSPRPTPKLVAEFKPKGTALAISKGVDRDRAVDESGNKPAVFDRRGSRPFNLDESARLYRTLGGAVYWVSDEPATPPRR